MEGYSKLAHLMATQHEFAIFRRFRALNIKSLLYLQADIANDEAILDELASRDSRYGDGEFQMKDWWTLSQGNEKHGTEQWNKVLEIRDKLDKYSMISHPIALAFRSIFFVIQMKVLLSKLIWRDSNSRGDMILSSSEAGSKDPVWDHFLC